MSFYEGDSPLRAPVKEKEFVPGSPGALYKRITELEQELAKANEVREFLEHEVVELRSVLVGADKLREEMNITMGSLWEHVNGRMVDALKKAQP